MSDSDHGLWDHPDGIWAAVKERMHEMDDE